MVSLCWLLWSVSASCYGQSLLVVMVSLCWLLWSVSVGCYGQSPLETWLLWSVSVGDDRCYGQLLLEARLIISLLAVLAVWLLGCLVGCFSSWAEEGEAV